MDVVIGSGMNTEKRDRRVYYKAYRANHRDKARAYGIAYAAAHKDEKRAYDAAYDDAHLGERREKHAREYSEFLEWLQILRAVNGCEDCETHEGELEHHHVDPTTKLYNVSQMYSFSLDTLEDELEKCVVQCEPCHKKRHVEMRAA